MPKYLIKAKIQVDGIVEKPDVIGAIFGQTEGLLGDQFDLRKLQDKGRIGRIHVDLKVHGNKSVGEVIIPSNLDRVETALVAAMIEVVDKVGPYNAKLEVIDIIDVRLEKIKKIVERAKEILSIWSRQKSPDIKEIIQEIESVLKPAEIIKYGPEQLPAGPNVDTSDELIIVEGRADVINLLRYGYHNVIAIGGAKPEVPKTVRELAKRKKRVIVFLDGDHAGNLILKELLKSDLKIDYIARAPPDREVEELTGREIEEALSKAIPIHEYIGKKKHLVKHIEARKPREKIIAPLKPPVEKPREVEEILSIPSSIVNDAKALYGTLEAILYDKEWNKIERLPVRNLVERIEKINEGMVHAIVFDGIVTQRLLDKSKDKNIRVIIGTKLGNIQYKPPEILVLTINDIT